MEGFSITHQCLHGTVEGMSVVSAEFGVGSFEGRISAVESALLYMRGILEFGPGGLWLLDTVTAIN